MKYELHYLIMIYHNVTLAITDSSMTHKNANAFYKELTHFTLACALSFSLSLFLSFSLSTARHLNSMNMRVKNDSFQGGIGGFP